MQDLAIFIPQACETSSNNYVGLQYKTAIKPVSWSTSQLALDLPGDFC